MKQQYRHTKAAVSDERDRPQKKRGGKAKPYKIASISRWSSKEFTIGRYETFERAEQALVSLRKSWPDCVLVSP
jgi:hypothetical protein